MDTSQLLATGVVYENHNGERKAAFVISTPESTNSQPIPADEQAVLDKHGFQPRKGAAYLEPGTIRVEVFGATTGSARGRSCGPVVAAYDAAKGVWRRASTMAKEAADAAAAAEADQADASETGDTGSDEGQSA